MFPGKLVTPGEAPFAESGRSDGWLVHLQDRAQLGEWCGADAVGDGFSVSDLAKQSGISQLLQVVGDRGLAQAGLLGEFRNADGSTPVLGELGEES